MGGDIVFDIDDAYRDEGTYLDDMDIAYPADVDTAYLDDMDTAYPADVDTAYLDDMDTAYPVAVDTAYPVAVDADTFGADIAWYYFL